MRTVQCAGLLGGRVSDGVRGERRRRLPCHNRFTAYRTPQRRWRRRRRIQRRSWIHGTSTARRRQHSYALGWYTRIYTPSCPGDYRAFSRSRRTPSLLRRENFFGENFIVDHRFPRFRMRRATESAGDFGMLSNESDWLQLNSIDAANRKKKSGTRPLFDTLSTRFSASRPRELFGDYSM